MMTNRFDAISKLFASRKTRRGTIAGGLGLAAATVGSRALAQEGTPEVATPTIDPDDPHPSADAPKPEFLFTQAFENGTWAPKDGEEHAYTLTLTGASAQTIYFSDRPERIFGTTPMQQFLDGLGFSLGNPPNAALVAPNADTGEEETLIIELLNPRYDASRATLTYDARVLADYQEDGLAHAATRQMDYDFPATFDRGSLFIDDCPDTDLMCYHVVNDEQRDIGEIDTVGTCWDRGINCLTCDLDFSSWYYGQLCAEAYPDQCFYGPQPSIGPGNYWDCYVYSAV